MFYAFFQTISRQKERSAMKRKRKYKKKEIQRKRTSNKSQNNMKKISKQRDISINEKNLTCRRSLTNLNLRSHGI